MNLKCGYFAVGGIMCGSLVGIFVGALAVNASLGYMILLLGAWGLCLMKTINLRWMYPHYRHDEFVDVTDEVWAAMYQAQREMENYERRKVYHRAYYSLDAYSWLENYALEHSRSPEDILLEREEMTTRLHLIAALPVALAHATPTQARRVHAYYIAGIKQPEISRREGVHSSKVSVAIHRGLRNMRRCYDVLFQTE